MQIFTVPSGGSGTDGTDGVDGADGAGLPAPTIILDSINGIVHFENTAGMQIEVYKYSRHKRGPHAAGVLPAAPGQPYSDRKGKRFRPLVQLANGATSWTIPDRWIFQATTPGIVNLRRRNHFRFGLRDVTTGARGSMTPDVVSTSVRFEFLGTGGSLGRRAVLNISGMHKVI